MDALEQLKRLTQKKKKKIQCLPTIHSDMEP